MVQTDRFVPVNHVMHYLWGEPLAPSIDDFFTLGAHLYEIGRFPHRLPAVMLGGFDLVATHADSTPPVTPEVLPFRPNLGMYLVIEAPEGDAGPTAWSADDVDALLAVDGVAGFWHFNPGALRTDRFDPSGFSAPVIYLDDDPVATAARIEPVLTTRWAHDGIAPAFAAPFAAMRPWEWDRHGQPGAPAVVSDALAAHLHREAHVAIADGCGAPTGLGRVLADAARAVGGVHVLLGWSLAAPINVHDTVAFPDIRTVMTGYALRAPVRDGHVRYVPTRLGSVPRLLAATWRPDVLVAALRPGARGLVFGSEVGWMRAAVDTGATVLAEVNHGLPDASDGVPVPADQVVVVAETDRPPHQFTTNPSDDVARAIATHVAGLIPEGAFLQYGPGTIADAILRAVDVPVRVDSGLVGDAVLDLDARGLLLGTPRGAYLAGTQPLYDWADGRAILAPVEVTHDVSRLAADDCFVAINTALEIDPVGQVNVERVGGQPVGGIGGHADFALAGSRSRHGLSVIAMPSAHRAGPTLVDTLSAPVTTTRADVDVVVTEHGVADLRGRDDREREQALRALWG